MRPPLGMERQLVRSLCNYPELIDDSLFGIRPGRECLGDQFATVRNEDLMPNGRKADIVFVEPQRITVVEVKRDALYVSQSPRHEDPVDQIVDYLEQCESKYPGRAEYRGFIVGRLIPARKALDTKLAFAPYRITPLLFGVHIPAAIRICPACKRAVRYESSLCVCGISVN